MPGNALPYRPIIKITRMGNGICTKLSKNTDTGYNLFLHCGHLQTANNPDDSEGSHTIALYLDNIMHLIYH